MNNFTQLFLNYLSTTNDGFDATSYLNQLKHKTNLVDFIYNDMKKVNLLFPFTKDQKNDARANEIRENGNKLYKSQNYKEALTLYTESIKYAASKSALALIHANRSICLLKLGMRKECLQEIDRALENGYNDRKKLEDRRIHANKLGESPEAYYDPPPKILEKNPLIQCAKDCVRIENNEKYGRHVVATRDIQIGEVIAVEPPFACSLVSGFLTHCHHCLDFCQNLIPCDGCTCVLFCGDDCKKQAMDSYHKYICPIMKTLMDYDTSLGLLGLIVTLKALDDFPNLDNFKFNKDKMYRSDRYEEIHNLADVLEKRDPMELLSKCIVAAMTVYFLQDHGDIFKCEKTREIFKQVYLRQILICDLNAIRLSEYVVGTKNTDEFGGGLYSFCSLFNHSCCYNVVRFAHGSTMVLRAFGTIKKGQQCFLSYGFQYDYTSKVERQMGLKQRFYFDCDCKACEGNWVLWQSDNPTIHKELGMTAEEFNSTFRKLQAGDRDVIKRHLKRFIKGLKKCEKYEPIGNAADMKELIYACFRRFGNRIWK